MRTYCKQKELYSVLCGNLNGKEIQKRGNICIYTTDSFYCKAEVNTILESNYTLIKIKNLKKRMNDDSPSGKVGIAAVVQDAQR